MHHLNPSKDEQKAVNRTVKIGNTSYHVTSRFVGKKQPGEILTRLAVRRAAR